MDYIPLETPGASVKKRNRGRSKRSSKMKVTGKLNDIESRSPSVGAGRRKSEDGVKRRRSSYEGCDAKLIPRIKQYVNSCDQNKNIKVDNVVEYLQQSYLEYRRKKKSSFKVAVSRGIEFVRESEENKREGDGPVDVESGASSDLSNFDSDFSIDNDSYVLYEDTNSANNTLREMYTRKPENGTKTEQPLPAVDGVGDKLNRLAPKNDLVSDNSKKRSGKRRLSVNNLKSENVANVKKSKSREFLPHQSSITFSCIGGIEECIKEVGKLIAHLKHPEIFSEVGVTPPRGMLLHGPPGCGKTLLANAIAGELGLPYYSMAATELVTGVSGESEEKIRDLFDTAVANAPSIIFLDEVDAITPKRDTVQREMERRIVSQLLVCMDNLNSKDVSLQVLVIGATNRPDALDPALRRAGRFDREICMGIPDKNARMRILKILCRSVKLAPTVDLLEIAKETPGYVGADLMALTREAAMCAVDRGFLTLESQSTLHGTPETEQESPVGKTSTDVDKSVCGVSWIHDKPPLTKEQMKDLFVEMDDFKVGLKKVQPSAKREGFATVPDVTWADIGALREVREELQLSIMAPIKYRDEFDLLGLTMPAGILLSGPPGCGKTLLAKAIANESGVNFISVKGPELLNMYLGESERAVRQCFQRAQNSSPCVIFFDEIDALCPRRSDGAESGASSRVVNQLLTEMDGISGRKDVFILAATNRPDILDPAVLRPGRLEKILFINLPSREERVDILNAITKCATKPRFGPDVSLQKVAIDQRCDGFTGADLASLIREASLVAVREFIACDNLHTQKEHIIVKQCHFEKAFERVRLSVSPRDQRRYEAMKLRYSRCGVVKTPVPMDIAEQSSVDCMDFISDNATEIG